jgi:hypothetical protein
MTFHPLKTKSSKHTKKGRTLINYNNKNVKKLKNKPKVTWVRTEINTEWATSQNWMRLTREFSQKK